MECSYLIIPAFYHTESDTRDNTACISFTPALQVYDPYPNPVIGTFKLDLILPDQKNIILQLIGNDGKICLTRSYTKVSAGFNSFMIETDAMKQGNYLLRILYDDQSIFKKIGIVR